MKEKTVSINMIKLKIENGYYLLKLEDLIIQNNLSLNKIIRDTNTDFKVLKRIMTGKLVRIDIYVIARLCDYFNCSMKDIIEYVPNKK